MKRQMIVCGCAAILLSVAPGYANPTPYPDVEDLKRLPRVLVDGGTAAEEERWVRLLGQHGFRFLDADGIEFIHEHFEALKSYLIASQEPGRPIGGSNYSLHSHFRRWAGPVDRYAMERVLRRTLAEPITRAKDLDPHPILMAGRDWAPREVLYHCAAVAEILSDYGDAEAIPLIERLLAITDTRPNDRSAQETRPYLERALRRIAMPESAGILVRLDTGAFAFHADPQSVRAVFLTAPATRSQRVTTTDPRTCAEVTRALRQARPRAVHASIFARDRRFHAPAPEREMGIAFANGDTAWIVPVVRKMLIGVQRALEYRDNTRFELQRYHGRYLLDARALARALEQLMKSAPEETDRRPKAWRR